MNEHYIAVLADLRQRRTRLENELRDLDATISGIQRWCDGIQHQPQSPTPEPAQEQRQSTASATRFANMSVRWGVLWHLAEFANGYEKTGEIANALLAGGYKSEAARFGNLVSAVLSNMKAKGEVETSEDGGYRLTDDGRKTWNLIRQGAKFRTAISSSEPPLLSVQ